MKIISFCENVSGYEHQPCPDKGTRNASLKLQQKTFILESDPNLQMALGWWQARSADLKGSGKPRNV